MQANNRQYMAVEGSEYLPDEIMDSRAAKGNIIEVESIKEVRRVHQQPLLPHRPSPIHRRMLASGGMDSKRCPSPALSGVTTHQEYFKEMETAMLSENNNLKEHNHFLKRQIDAMFERQRKCKAHINNYRDRLRQLQALNSHLQEQLHLLITSILSQIERIQALIDEQHNSLSMHSFEPTPKHSQGASQTESTIHKDLEDLKAKVKQIYNKKYIPQEPEPLVFIRSDYKSDHSSRHTDQQVIPQLHPQKFQRLRDSEEGANHPKPKLEKGRKQKPI